MCARGQWVAYSLLIMGACGGQQVRWNGPLEEEAAAAIASSTRCGTTEITPVPSAQGPFLYCRRESVGAKFAVVADSRGRVLTVAIEMMVSPVMIRATFDSIAEDHTRRFGPGAKWCDPSPEPNQLWVSDSAYSVLVADTTRSIVNLSQTIGKPYCQ